jgi:hypothetical protein
MYARARRRGRRQQPIDEGGGNAMRGGGEQGGHRGAADDGLQLIGRRKFQIRIGAAQVRKGIRNLRARLAIRQHGGHVKLRMTGYQAQEFAGHIAGAAEHNGRRGGVHSPTAFGWRTLRNPSAPMM